MWAENEENAKLCVKCENAFETASQKSAPNTETGTRETSFKMDTEEVQDTDSFGIGKVIGLEIVSIFILIGLGLGVHNISITTSSLAIDGIEKVSLIASGDGIKLV